MTHKSEDYKISAVIYRLFAHMLTFTIITPTGKMRLINKYNELGKMLDL